MRGEFGAEARKQALKGMATGSPGAALDLLVIGGGITGAGLARDAALRGLEVGLVEQDDFASGTSSRSTKIIHGGIRYLAYGWLRTVRESARERAVLRRIAPHLVHPLAFVYPLYGGQSKLVFRAGFWLFDLLAGVDRKDRHVFLSSEEVLERVPGLREDLRGGVVYGEYSTDDARLTLENAMSAARHGASIANHAEATGFLTDAAGERILGVEVLDRLTGESHEIAARVVVNATGPWAEQTLEDAGLNSHHDVLPSKGIHLLFRAGRLPIHSATHLRAPSGREGLAIRRGDYVYVGTSDVEYRGPLHRPVADRKAIEDVFRLITDCFPRLDLTEDDIIGTWAGVRPLIAVEGKSPRDTPREDEIWRTRPGLLTIAGGKLTTYRRMGQRILDAVAEELERELPGRERTAEVPLPGAQAARGGGVDPLAGDGSDSTGTGGERGDPGRRMGDYLDGVAARLREIGVSPAAADRITWLYGSAGETLLSYAEEDGRWAKAMGSGVPAIRGEIRLAVEEEMALTLLDILDRRTSLLIFSDDHGRSAAPEAARIAGDLLGWDADRRESELKAYLEAAESADMDAGQASDAGGEGGEMENAGDEPE